MCGAWVKIWRILNEILKFYCWLRVWCKILMVWRFGRVAKNVAGVVYFLNNGLTGGFDNGVASLGF